ncbi:MAG: SH3 domain-containing protein [Turneriella sp.]|nr:SH3 domain-containing protein [Turneriella sp.]
MVGSLRRRRWQRLLTPVAISAFVLAGVAILAYRFGETPEEKAERLFRQRQLVELRSFTQKQLESGKVSALLMGYYAVATYSTNGKAELQSLLSNLRAVDDRPVFAREVLQRIWEIGTNHSRAAEILEAALLLENPPHRQTRELLSSMLESDANFRDGTFRFEALASIFPERVRIVAASGLQVREAPGMHSAVRGQLKKGERLLLRRELEETKVAGRSGRWSWVLNKNLESGWVFGGYLTTGR